MRPWPLITFDPLRLQLKRSLEAVGPCKRLGALWRCALQAGKAVRQERLRGAPGARRAGVVGRAMAAKCGRELQAFRPALRGYSGRNLGGGHGKWAFEPCFGWVLARF